ncbi:MAG: glycosyltransferase family 2 protein, partial [Clostridia bacterium]|nr:glycosyltransferase family 2 protein [Clostridia bacterium]
MIEKISIIANQITQMEKLKNHAQRDIEPVKRLCKYDSYLYYFKHFGKYIDEKYFYKINDINLDNIDVSFSNNLVDMSVSISNCITSIKALKDIFDDKFIIEQCSIYSIMAQDEIFKEMDICSQYAYMSAISKLSTLYGASERSVAKSAIRLSKKFDVHFGEIIYDYRYAIKADLHSLAPQILQKPTTKPDQRLYATVVALLSIALTTLSIIFLPTWKLMVGIGVIMFFASLPLARFVVALIVDSILPSRSVASMNYKELPVEGKTLVVKCEYIASVEQAKEACDNLLDLAFANKDKMLEYSLLVDLKSSKNQVDDADSEIYKVFDGMSKYENINVFVRRRSNIGGVWKAYERKRGATNALNSALISGSWQDFCYVLRNQEKPNFVLLLDEDNALMPGAIKRAVNTMLHPLNAKYTLLTFSSRYKLASLTTPWTMRYVLDSGVDSYCNYGDFYYKISGNAIYCGKGIYRLDEYVEKLKGKLPDGKILSHDIVEGAIVSAGSLSVPTYEDAPTGLVSHVVRQNRWQRGDILLFPYIFSKKVTQPFYRYVMAYNIVKTILPICQFILLSMLILTGELWLLLPFAISFAGIYLIRFGLCLNALNYGKRMRYVLSQFAGEVGEMIFDFLTLPFEAVQSILLWIKMLFKLIFDRKNLLEWKTFYSTQRGNTLSKHIGLVLPSCILSIVLAGIF